MLGLVPRLVFAFLVAATTVVAPALARHAPAHAATIDHRAVVIGINQFMGRTRPNVGGVGDAHDMRDVLLRQGWPADRIRVLTDGEATADSIRAALQWLAGNTDASSQSVFFYSGHTKQLSGDPDGDGEAVDEFLWPHDNRFISDGELAGYLRSIGGDAWIGIAGCEAAGFDDGISNDRRTVTASSLEPEKSYEFPEWGNSVWGGLFVDQGMLQGKADADRNGEVTIGEAAAYAARIAPEMTAAQKPGPQHPYLSGGGGHRTLRYVAPAPAPEPAAQPAPAAGGAPAPQRLCIGAVCVPDLSVLVADLLAQR